MSASTNAAGAAASAGPGSASASASSASTAQQSQQQSQQQPLQAGIVRSVLSGDTLILRPRNAAPPGGAGALGQQKTIHVAGIAAPRLGTRDREDEVSALGLCLFEVKD